jgi:predicted nucleotidyltransferase
VTTPDGVADVLARAFREASPPGVVAVYLFGSHAAGTAHRESDVDVAVLLDRQRFAEAEARFHERVRLASWLISALHRPLVDVVVLNDAPPTFARRIVTSGVRVFCADEEQAHAFTRDVQLRAADLEPFLRRTRRLKLAALRR